MAKLENLNKKSSNEDGLNSLKYWVMLSALLSTISPVIANNQTNSDSTNHTMEVVVPNPLDSINKKIGVILPDWYNDKLYEFLLNNDVMQDSGIRAFTEDFVINQMKKEWGIDKQNQLLFIWYAIYEEITGKDLYDWEDWNERRLEEFENTVDLIDECWKKYNKEFWLYAQKRSADAQKRSADAQKRSADAIKESIRLTNERLWHLIKFHELYKKNPSVAKTEEIQHMKNSAKEIISEKNMVLIIRRFFLLRCWSFMVWTRDFLKLYRGYWCFIRLKY